jgi:hypothetical protein
MAESNYLVVVAIFPWSVNLNGSPNTLYCRDILENGHNSSFLMKLPILIDYQWNHILVRRECDLA